MVLPAEDVKATAHGVMTPDSETTSANSVPAKVTGNVFGSAKLTPTSRMNPAISDTQIDLTMPFAAWTFACIVSSDT